MATINIYPKKKEYENFLKLFPIQRSNKFLPNWYKEMQLGKEELHNINAKNCPAIQDIVSTGFIIPLWSGFRFETTEDVENNTITQNWYMTATEYGDGSKIEEWIGKHSYKQSIGMDYGKLAEGTTLKLHSPYIFEIPDGYNLLFTDPFYHFKKQITCLSGIVEADKWGDVAFPFAINQSNFYIKAGTPLIHCYLYKRENEKLIVNNKSFNKKFADLQQLRRDEIVVARKDYRNLKN